MVAGPASAGGAAPSARAERISAEAASTLVADDGSWRPWLDDAVPAADVGAADAAGGAELEDYAGELARARAATGHVEAVLVGDVRVGGVRACLLAWEFGFLGGSIGVDTARRLVAGIRRATAEGLPLLALPRSGGTRMQEGTPAFVQMTAITAAVAEHRRAGLPYLVHLCHPTTGGVLATLGSAGDLTSAEPGAFVGFLGPRAVAAITGEPLSSGVQVAENLVAHGIVDHVLPWPALRDQWGTALRLWADRAAGSGVPGRPEVPEAGASAGHGPARDRAPETAEQLWALVQASRATGRAGAAAWLTGHIAERVDLPGTGAGEVGSGVRVGLGRVGGVPVVFAGTVDRTSGEPLTTSGLRVIRRGIALANRWGLPVVTVVDTLGAQLSDAAEEGGIAGEISRLMLDLVSSPTPTVAVLLGPGTGGSALALLAADRVVATSHAWVAPLPPEGAAAIRHRGDHDPARVAWDQRIGAHALADLGFVDVLLDETAPDWGSAAERAVTDALTQIVAGVDPERRVTRFAAWSGGPRT